MSLNKSLVGGQDETRKPIGAKVFGNPLGLGLGALSVIVLVGRRDKLDLVAIRKHFLNGLDTTVFHDGIQFDENDAFNHGARIFFLAFDPRSTRFRRFHLFLLLFFALVVVVVDSHVDDVVVDDDWKQVRMKVVSKKKHSDIPSAKRADEFQTRTQQTNDVEFYAEMSVGI